jgi:hypothetical protein
MNHLGLALTAWYICACTANWAAVSADTSSAAAGNTPVVGAAAALFCALIIVPAHAKLVAAALSASGWVTTKDIGVPLDRCAYTDDSRRNACGDANTVYH